MQALTRRGMEIAGKFRSAGISVIESYPGAAQDIMRIPRKRASLDQLRAGLTSFGVRGIRGTELITHDELDSVTSAVVGVFYLADLYESLGSDSEGKLIVPLLRENANPMDTTMVKELTPRKPILFLLTGPARQEAAEQALSDFSVAAATSLVDAKRHMEKGGNAVMVLREPTRYEQLLASVGPQARCIVAASGSPRRLLKSAPFCDVMLNVEDPGWKSHLHSWLVGLEKEGDLLCR
jgi:hypothetical protein